MVISRECVETNVTARRTQAGPAALSFAQQRLWFFDQMEPESALYSMPVALRLGGALNVPVLQRCLSEVLRRHEILRTRYEAVNGQPAQVIEPAAPLEMPLIDLICQPEPEAEARRFCAGEARRPFDLRHGLMLRASLFRLGATDHILFLNLHHIASDGWSKGLLLRELKTLYGILRRCPNCGFSMRTLRCGSGSGCRARLWNSNWAIGGSNWKDARRCWKCPPTGHDRPGKPIAAR